MMMVEAVLSEELERLREAEKSYRRQIEAASKGSIQRKRINGNVYPYLVFRVGKQVHSRYLGRLPKADLEKLSREIESRNKQREMLLQVRRNISRIDKMINGRNASV